MVKESAQRSCCETADNPYSWPPPPPPSARTNVLLVHTIEATVMQMLFSCALSLDFRNTLDSCSSAHQASRWGTSTSRSVDQTIKQTDFYRTLQKYYLFLSLYTLVVMAGAQTVATVLYCINMGESINSVEWRGHGLLVNYCCVCESPTRYMPQCGRSMPFTLLFCGLLSPQKLFLTSF